MVYHHYPYFYKLMVVGGPVQSLMHPWTKKYLEKHILLKFNPCKPLFIAFPSKKNVFLKNSQWCHSGPILNPLMVTGILVGVIQSASDGLIYLSYPSDNWKILASSKFRFFVYLRVVALDIFQFFPQNALLPPPLIDNAKPRWFPKVPEANLALF